MIKTHNSGRPSNNEELAEILHALNPGETLNVYGITEGAARLANSLSRTHKRHVKTRLSIKTRKNGTLKITCVLDKKPNTVIII